MIPIGQISELEILRQTSVGLFLGDGHGHEVLLPLKYVPASFEIGDMIEVFVYLDHEERIVATTRTPLILLDEFALLQVMAVNDVGAFVDWGMEKQLLVPFREQKMRMEPGRWYVIRLCLDEKTGRLYGSNRIEKFLDNDFLTVQTGDEVEVLVLQRTDLGWSVIVNHLHKGLIYSSEVFRELRIGEKLRGFVNMIRPGNKIDISLQPVGYESSIGLHVQALKDALLKNQGVLPLSDESSPEEIAKWLGMSKKAFKKAVGALYRAGEISLHSGSIRLETGEKS